jgi:hypothetical protein
MGRSGAICQPACVTTRVSVRTYDGGYTTVMRIIDDCDVVNSFVTMCVRLVCRERNYNARTHAAARLTHKQYVCVSEGRGVDFDVQLTH